MKERGQKFNRRDFLRISAMTAMGGIVAACVPSAPPPAAEKAEAATAAPAPARVVIWKAAHLPAGEEGKLVQGLLEKFNADHADIIAEYVEISWDGWMEKHISAFASGEPPDITYQPDVFALQFIRRDQLLTVEEFPDVAQVKAQFYPLVWEAQAWQGKVYGVPLIVGGSALFWNKAHFEEAGLDPDRPPDTWEEQITFAQKLTKADRPGMLICAGPCDQYPHETYPFLLQAGAKLFNEDRSKATFNSPAGVAGVQYMVDLVHKYKVAPRPEDLIEGMFEQGLVSFRTAQIGGMVSVMRKEHPDVRLGIGPAPKGPAPEPEGRATYGGSGMLSISRASRSPNAAWEVIKYLTSPGPLKAWIGDGLHWFSVRPDTVFYADDPLLKDAEPLIKYMAFWPSTQWNVQEWDILGRYLTAALNGEIGAQEALDQAANEMNALRG